VPRREPHRWSAASPAVTITRPGASRASSPVSRRSRWGDAYVPAALLEAAAELGLGRHNDARDRLDRGDVVRRMALLDFLKQLDPVT
jgi:hypothetical protein